MSIVQSRDMKFLKNPKISQPDSFGGLRFKIDKIRNHQCTVICQFVRKKRISEKKAFLSQKTFSGKLRSFTDIPVTLNQFWTMNILEDWSCGHLSLVTGVVRLWLLSDDVISKVGCHVTCFSGFAGPPVANVTWFPSQPPEEHRWARHLVLKVSASFFYHSNFSLHLQLYSSTETSVMREVCIFS